MWRVDLEIEVEPILEKTTLSGWGDFSPTGTTKLLKLLLADVNIDCLLVVEHFPEQIV
ncbi:hypothetical protein KIN20_003534 [Parelaphostrongylus tenuis]|uniref:Uncharacterized protein n=1 Tax=Parelaphostrongylus tenuis TaxID=148309 RepID=A0AAD5M1M0_PARTN|nr:hypothetical protein KIN20_003534 [Parelaphostrongylus tenuis]